MAIDRIVVQGVRYRLTIDVAGRALARQTSGKRVCDRVLSSCALALDVCERATRSLCCGSQARDLLIAESVLSSEHKHGKETYSARRNGAQILSSDKANGSRSDSED